MQSKPLKDQKSDAGKIEKKEITGPNAKNSSYRERTFGRQSKVICYYCGT